MRSQATQIKIRATMIVLNLLHILNDGYKSALVLLLPFAIEELNINLAQVGVLGSLINVFDIALAIPAGYLALRFGGLFVLIAAMLLYAVGFLGVAFSDNFLWLCIFFMVSGLGFGVFHPIAFALVSKVSEASKRGKRLGDFTALGDVGRIGIAATITFVIVYIGWRNTAIAAFILAIIFFCALLLTKDKEIKSRAKNAERRTAGNIWLQVKNKKLILASLSGFFDSFASSSIFVFLPFLLLSKGYPATLLGPFTAALFVGNFLGKSALGRLVDRFGSFIVFAVAETMMALSILLLVIYNSEWAVIMISLLLGILSKGTVPVIKIFTSEAISKDQHEEGFAVHMFIDSIGVTLSPLVLGLIADRWGIVYSFYACALIAMVAIIPALFLRRASKANPQTG